MAHYAYLDKNNLVIAVIVGKDETELIDGLDTETYYALNTPYTVKRTSYNGHIRANFAGVGYFYDAQLDVFIPPQPYPSWILNQNTYLWEAPIPYPNNADDYHWNESNQNWEPYVSG